MGIARYAFIIVGLLAMLTSANAVRAQYRLAPGDVVQLTVAGVTDLEQRSTVGIDGIFRWPGLSTQAERTGDDVRLRLKQFEDQRRIRLMAELQTANVGVEAARLKLGAVGEKFEYVGMVKSQLISGISKSKRSVARL
jgi:hypothetical protein